VFKPIKDIVQNILERPEQRNVRLADPFKQDPIARDTGWSSLKGWSTKWASHILVHREAHRVELKASALTNLVCLTPMLMGLCLMKLFESSPHRGQLLELSTTQVTDHGVLSSFGSTPQWVHQVLSGIGQLPITEVFLIFASVLLLIHLGKPAFFDLKQGRFWRGSQRQQSPRSSEISLDHIHAIQLIISDMKDRRAWCYEVNLVLKDSNRINLVSSQDLSELQRQAQYLGDFLKIPVWDVSSR
jgi:hypothetical protein